MFYSEFANDILVILNYCGNKGFYFNTPYECERLWISFSGNIYYANWITPNETYLPKFIEYLRKNINKVMTTAG